MLPGSRQDLISCGLSAVRAGLWRGGSHGRHPTSPSTRQGRKESPQGWSAFLVDMPSGVQLALLAGWPATCLCRQCCVSTKLRKDFPTAFFIVWRVFRTCGLFFRFISTLHMGRLLGHWWSEGRGFTTKSHTLMTLHLCSRSAGGTVSSLCSRGNDIHTRHSLQRPGVHACSVVSNSLLPHGL